MPKITLVLLAFPLVYCDALVKQPTPLYRTEGDLNLVILLNDCQNASDSAKQTFIHSAIWTVHRINFLELLSTLKLGVKIYEICSKNEYFGVLYEAFRGSPEDYLLGVISDKALEKRVKEFSDILNVKVKYTKKFVSSLIEAASGLLNALKWNDNVTLVAHDSTIVKGFYRRAKLDHICVKRCLIYGKECLPKLKDLIEPLIVFGNHSEVVNFLKEVNNISTDAIYIPTDGSIIKALPQGTLTIIPPHVPPLKSNNHNDVFPTPLLFEIAQPIISYVQQARQFIYFNCNETTYKKNCIAEGLNHQKTHSVDEIEPLEILNLLKIGSLRDNFVYDIYKAEDPLEISVTNSTSPLWFRLPYTKILTYGIFDGNFSEVANFEIPAERDESCYGNRSGCQCLNLPQLNFGYTEEWRLLLREESWVFAFLAIALLGILFCLAILIFLCVALIRKEPLEGNPTMSVILLVVVLLMYCSILPYSLKGSKSVEESLCLVRSLWTMLTFAAAFSLLLSRSIVLITVAKEIGFMSHVAGSVQSFLCLFIFGVQAALSLQIIGKCNEKFHSLTFLYLMSYNIMLLLLNLCLCPLIYKTQRNYKEGKHFTYAVGTIVVSWLIWLPCYVVLDEQWKDLVACIGLLLTASIILGTIFIPRTYMMTVAAARDHVTNRLPSFPTATSVVDIYRSNTQPVYDCVNVAAINAVTVAGSLREVNRENDIYCCPTLPEEEDLDLEERSVPPTPNDKVTRF